MLQDADIVEEETVTLSSVILEEGKFYRNKLGRIVLIVGLVEYSTSWYKKGYRFIDERGSYYKPNGSLDSKMWQSLDLIEVVNPIEVTDDDMEKIRKGFFHNVSMMNITDKVGAFGRKLFPFTIVLNACLLFSRVTNKRPKKTI